MLIARIQRGMASVVPPDREEVLPRLAMWTVTIIVLIAGLFVASMWIAATKADELAMARQQNIVSTYIAQSFKTIAKDQEASTVWDDAVIRMQSPVRDNIWIDNNLGIWFNQYYRHDEVFLVNPSNQIFYAMQGGVRGNPAAYQVGLGDAGKSLIAELRGRLRDAGAVTDDTIRSPGAIDIGIVHGHPAIISVKPIVPETDRISQAPGTENVHVSIRYLDGNFIADLAQHYQLEQGRFAKSVPADQDFGSVALRDRKGGVIGYIVWKPFRPGSAMLRSVAPILVALLLIVLSVVGFLLRQISNSTLRLSAARRHAQHLADHDPLTSLANRALFDKELGERLGQLWLTGRKVALFYVDLDHFKNVNDHLGHPTGDLLIVALSRILAELAPDDVVARLGGDEFAIIHVADDAVASAEKLARKIHRALARPIDLGDGEVLVGASIGIAIAPQDATEPVELVRKADIALYDAKLTGRRRHSFYIEAMGDRIRERSEIEADLREAMRTGDGLSVVYQPFFNARSGAIVGAEALIRWDHPTRGPTLPEQFIPIAEECGLIETLNEWVLEQACSTAARWPSGMISVNLSAVQLRNATLAERVFAILKRTRLSPDRLELEITETSFLESNDRCRSSLGWLSDIGVQIALDDFGTGYSSFKHLRGFEVDRVKIDHSFVSTIQFGQGGSPVIKAIVDLARTSGLQTTAEGVETEQQRLFLTSIGCDVLQGFLLCEPLAAAEIEKRFSITSEPAAS